MADNKNQQMQVEVPQEEMQGRYSNFAIISHSPNDFFMDLILMAPNTPKARVQSRVIMTPESAKQLAIALQQNIQNYEKTFGEIRPRVPAGGNTIMDFPLPKGEA